MVPTRKSARSVSLLIFAILAGPVSADPPLTMPEQPAQVLTLETAIALTLQRNPELAVARRQRGIAESGMVIARTYPFNPVATTAVMAIGGPGDAGITNRVFNQNTLTQEVEVRGQGKIRRAAAAAALSRVEWEVATQEQQMAVRTMRAFLGYVYQQEKLRVLDETVRLQEETAAKVKQLTEQGKLRPADLLLVRFDEAELRAQRGPRLNQTIAAWHDLRMLLGVQTEVVSVAGRLARSAPPGDAAEWTRSAYGSRADLHAVDVAYQEAEQLERLEIANRFGNPNIGLKTEYNESRIYFTGGTLQCPLPWFNTRRGEILRRRAEKEKVLADRHRLEIQIQQQVLAAMDRLREAQKSVQLFETDILPAARQTRDAFDKLFAQGEPGVDFLRWSEVHRRYWRSEDSYLDALWLLNQTIADLAAAVGDFTLAIGEACPLATLGPPQPVAPAP
jgi:outer membrane protein, heavy metal efflux system